nr:hypothetical protein [uncultured Cohaesibacter sp.]
MTEPSASRSLGDYKQLLEPFDRSFEEGRAEIPDEVKRSRKAIVGMRSAARNGKQQLEHFFKARSGQGREIKRSFRQARRRRRLVKLRYHVTVLWLTVIHSVLLLRVFVMRYRPMLFILLGFLILLYGMVRYGDDLLGLIRMIYGGA